MAPDLLPRALFMFGQDSQADSAGMENDTWRNNSILGIEFKRPLHLNLIMLGLGAMVAIANAALLYQMHRRRNALKAKRYVFLANLTFCDLLAGLLLTILSIANIIGIDGILVCILQGETCMNLCLTMCSYTCSIAIQFIAVKYPIYYKLTITKTKVLIILAICWSAAIAVSCIKVIYVLSLKLRPTVARILRGYPYLDLALRIFYVVGNCSCFFYVLVIAVRRRRQQATPAGPFQKDRARNKPVEGNDKEAVDQELGDDENITDRSPFRRKAMAYLHHYEAILTSGIRLVVYIGTCLPHTVYGAVLLISGNPAKIYWETRELGVALVLLWFCRAIVDPLITLIREKPMHPRRTSTTTSSGSGTTAVSYLKNSRGEQNGSNSEKKA